MADEEGDTESSKSEKEESRDGSTALGSRVRLTLDDRRCGRGVARLPRRDLGADEGGEGFPMSVGED